jgi:very-short-patch-repair endonuclease
MSPASQKNWYASKLTQASARRLRKESTPAEHPHWLEESKHYRVIRFADRDVLECTEAVIEGIRAALPIKQ